MIHVSENIVETIGNTPLLCLGRIVPSGAAEIFAKLEMFNPGGSVKDRICLGIMEAAEASGELKPGTTVIEPTSGNTGIGLALICAVKKYPLILVMPENYSMERRYMMEALGATLVLTPAQEEMPGAIAKAHILSREISPSWMLQQFSNPANPETHRRTTAQEIFREIPAKQIDALVVGVGTGGTLTGVGSELKKYHSEAQVVAVEPSRAAVLSGRPPAVHKIQGIGAGFLPETLDRSLIDRIETVDDDEALSMAKALSAQEGVLAGISSGAALAASLRVAKALGPGRKVVTVFPDKGERYFSIEKYFKMS